MTLTLKLLCCIVCRGDRAVARDSLHLDECDEEGRRGTSIWGYTIPKAKHRDLIAPDLCDQCWENHRLDMNHARRPRGGQPPPFRAMFLWGWVADQLEKEAKLMRGEARRLVPHLARKAERGRGRVMHGPLREDGPRPVSYGRAYYN